MVIWFEFRIDSIVSILYRDDKHQEDAPRVKTRGDSMIWNFTGRRPLSVRDYMVSLDGGPML